MGSTAAGRVVHMVVFVLNARVALHAVAVVCVDDLQGTESFTTPFRSVSESSALESYGIFRACVLSVRLPASSVFAFSRCRKRATPRVLRARAQCQFRLNRAERNCNRELWRAAHQK